MTKTGAQIAVEAMEKEYARLKRLEAAAEKEVDENLNSVSEIISVHKEFVEIVNSGRHDKEALRNLDLLKKRDRKARKAMKKNIIDLRNKHVECKFAAEDLMKEIIKFKFINRLAD